MSLNSELDQFNELFKRRLIDNSKAILKWVTAEEVDWEDRTMTASGDDDLKFFNILLGLGTVAVKPVIGTDCLIAIVENDDATAFMLYANEAELIAYNGGENGGLTNTPELKTQLEKLTARVDGIIDAIKDPTVIPTAQDGGNALWALFKGLIAQITEKENFDNIENEKIRH